MSVNKVILIGRLGRDPEIRYSQSGTAIAQLNMATDRNVKRDDEWVKETDWHRVVAFGKTAETCGEYLNKGSQIYIEGRLQTREWEDKEGNRRWTTEVVTARMQMLGGRGDAKRNAGPPSSEDPNPFNRGADDIADEDVPF